MKYVFLLNSFTLNKKLDKVKDKIIAACKKFNMDYIIEVNSLTESTEDVLKKYKNDSNIIIAVGGDGIINRTLNGIINTNNVLGFIPLGTGNDLYKSVKKQFKDGFNELDVVKINNKYFVNVACFGIDADVANNSDIIKSKLIPKKQRYNISVINSFVKYKSRQFEVHIKEDIINDTFTTIAVCNGSYYGGGYNIAPNSNLNNGLLDVYLAPRLKKFDMLRLILSMKKGKHEGSSKLLKMNASSLTIKSPNDITCNIDGEELTSKEFNIELIPKGITIYFNQELIDEVLK